MKTIIISIIIIVSFSLSVKSDPFKVNHNFTAFNYTVKQSPISDMLSLYYDIKNALVSGDANLAAAKAEEFVKSGYNQKPLFWKRHAYLWQHQRNIKVTQIHFINFKHSQHEMDIL